MKFKLKFEIVYPNIDKDIIRNMKIENLLLDTDMEVESDHPLSPPSKDDIIILSGKEYLISGIKHKVEKSIYTIIVEVEDKNLKLKEEEKMTRLKIENMINNYKNFSIK